MKNFSPFISKNIIYTFLAAAIIILPVAALNIFLGKEKDEIEDFISTSCGQKISIEKIIFLPPNTIVIRHVFFDSMLSFSGEPPFSIDELRLSLSLKKLILDKQLYIGKISLVGLKADFSNYVILNLDIKRIISVLKKKLKGKEMHITVKDGKVMLPFSNSSVYPIVLNAAVDIDDAGNVSGDGGLYLGQFIMHNSLDIHGGKPYVLRYKFKTRLDKESIGIDDLEIVNKDIYTKLIGRIHGNTLTMGGMISRNSVVRSYNMSFIEKLKRMFSRNKYAVFGVIGSSFHTLNIYDLNTKIEFLKHKIVIKYVKFSLSNIPFSLKGSLSFSHNIGVNLSFSSYPPPYSAVNNDNPKKMSLSCVGAYSKDRFNGSVILSFLNKTQNNRIHHRIEFLLRGLSLSFPGTTDDVRIKCAKADINYKAGNNVYKIFLKNSDSLCDIKDKRFKLFKFTSNIYDGFLKGAGYFNIERMPFRSSFRMNINNVSAQNLRNITVYFDKIHGEFNSVLKYKNHPYPHLYGDYTVSNGYLDNIMFFKWLAGFFDLPALRELHFSEISGRFSVDDEVSRLEDIRLKSDNVALKGYFAIDDNDMVSSKLYLAFSDELLDTSDKFKRLLKLLGKENAELVNFDFQLSGLFYAMNFQWLESDFKERLKELLPPMVERILERRIGKVVESISGKRVKKDN